MPTSFAPGVARNDGRAVAVEGDLRVGVVVDDQDVVLARELDDPLEEALGHDRAGRVVRVVEEHQLRPLGDRRASIASRSGTKPSSGSSAISTGSAPGEPRPAGVDGVAGVGRERVVARVQEGEVEVEDRLLGADRRDDLALGVERHVEAPLVEVARPPRGSPRGRGWSGTGAFRARSTASCIASTISGGVGPVGVADAEADHVDARRALGGDLALELRRTRTAGCAPGAYSVSCSSFVEVLAEAGPSNTGRAQPVSVTLQILPDLDLELAAVEQTHGHRARAAARAAGPRRRRPRRRSRRCPRTASPPPRARRCARGCAPARLRRCELGVPGHVGAVGEARVVSIGGPIAAEVELRRAPPRRRRGSRTGGCRSRRGWKRPRRARRRCSSPRPSGGPAGEVLGREARALPMSTVHVSGPVIVGRIAPGRRCRSRSCPRRSSRGGAGTGSPRARRCPTARPPSRRG